MLGQSQIYLILGLIGLLLVGLLGWLIYLQLQFNKLANHYSRLLINANVGDLKQAWELHLNKILLLTNAVTKISEAQLELSHRITNVIQKVGLLKYNANEDTGGVQSFLLALLNEKNTGVLINNIHSRAGTRVYAKEIKNGLTEHALTKEEEAAIHKANKFGG